MKNTLIVDLDTERTPLVQIGKTEPVSKEISPEALLEMLINDMTTLSGGLIELILMAHQAGFQDANQSLEFTIEQLRETLKQYDLNNTPEAQTPPNA